MGTTANGLPHNSIRSIAQTPDGYFWVATSDGLARFDGVGLTVFTAANAPGLVQDRIRALAAAGDGALWIGTGGEGVIRFRDGKFTQVAASELPAGFVRALDADSAGVVWIGTEFGLSKYEAGKVSIVFRGGRELHVHCLLEYPAGTLWAGTNSRLVPRRGSEKPGGPPHVAAFSRRPDDLPAERRHGMGRHH